jgi:hypothetical protein
MRSRETKAWFSGVTDEEQRKTAAAFGPPNLEWLDGDVPRAEGFGDTYFSKAGGLEETRHVFLSGNGLPERFEGRRTSQLPSSVLAPVLTSWQRFRPWRVSQTRQS